jgi:hypothetical protein
MRHPGTKQHTSKVIHVAHDARIARKIIMATMRATLTADRECSSIQLSSTVVSHRRGEPADSIFLREKSNSQLRYTRFVQEVWLVGVLLKQLLRQLAM